MQKDWLDIYCERHRRPGSRFGLVDWFITLWWWLWCVIVGAAIVSFVWGLAREFQQDRATAAAACGILGEAMS